MGGGRLFLLQQTASPYFLLFHEAHQAAPQDFSLNLFWEVPPSRYPMLCSEKFLYSACHGTYPLGVRRSLLICRPLRSAGHGQCVFIHSDNVCGETGTCLRHSTRLLPSACHRGPSKCSQKELVASSKEPGLRWWPEIRTECWNVSGRKFTAVAGDRRSPGVEGTELG